LRKKKFFKRILKKILEDPCEDPRRGSLRGSQKRILARIPEEDSCEDPKRGSLDPKHDSKNILYHHFSPEFDTFEKRKKSIF
jgi:hypothetical protein